MSGRKRRSTTSGSGSIRRRIDKTLVRRLSLATAVAVTLVTVTTLLLGALGVITYRAYAKSQWAALRGLEHIQAKELAVAMEMPVWNIDRPQIERVIEAMSLPKSIYGIIVSAGGEKWGRVRNGDWKVVPWNGQAEPSDLLIEERRIKFNGNDLGSVRLLVTTKGTEQDLREALLYIVVAIVAIELLLILVTYFALWRAVVQPLVKIERYAAGVRAGDVATMTAGRGFPAEIESLRSSIATMVQLLGIRYAELEELRRTEKMAVMGALVAGVAHEVRNPLFGMTAMLDAYDEELKAEHLGEFSDRIREQVTRLTHLMTELLEFGKPVRVTKVPGTLPDLVDEVIASRTGVAGEAGVTLHKTVDDNLPAMAMDRPRLRQVFDNLIDNAMQHSPAGGTVTVSGTEVRRLGRQWIELRVEDEGRGFNADDLSHVFEPFFTRRERGIGLGLPIVQRIVEEHRGHVTAANRPEGGAVITVCLPAL
jgi:signal transduction histidine kinase